MRSLNIDDSDIQIVAEYAARSYRWLTLGKCSFNSSSMVYLTFFLKLSRNNILLDFFLRWGKLNEFPPLACGSCRRRCLDLTRERTGIFLSQCGHILCSSCKPDFDWRQDRVYKDCPKCQEKVVILTEFKRDWTTQW